MAAEQSIHTNEHANSAITYKHTTTTQTGTLKDPFRNEEKKRPSRSGWMQAYGATLVTMRTVVHIVASVVTAVLYFLLSPSGVSAYPIWYAPVFGALVTYAVFLLIAVFCCKSIASLETANRRCYGL